MSEPRIGVFLCTCDGRIEDKVQVDAFQYVMRGNRDVALVQPMRHMCLPDDLLSLKSSIVEHHLDRVVIAACPARLQEKPLLNVCVESGVNRNQFALVDWREGCVNAHQDDKPVVTGKAIDLLQMAVARVSHASPCEPVIAPISSNVLVIGGGIAGMTAARTLADRGIKVTFVEQEAELGGALRGLSLDGASDIYYLTIAEVNASPIVQVLRNSRITSVSGSTGNYRVRIEEFPQPLPLGVAGSTTLIRGDRGGITESTFGAIVVATGAQEFRDASLERYDGHRVVTLSEFGEQLANLQSATLVPHASVRSQIANPAIPSGTSRSLRGVCDPPSAIIFLLCAGSHDARIPYCSNVCCLNALSQAIRVKRVYPESRVTVLFRDLYLLGDEMNEQIVKDAQRAGVEFVRYSPDASPHVSKETVEVRDAITHATRAIPYDYLVLATGIVPRQDAGVLASQLKLERDGDGFFIDPHRRLRPESQMERGIFVCGSAHRPVDVDTAILQGMTAAARAARFVEQKNVVHQGTSAWVDSKMCTGCSQCVQACGVQAISMQTPSLAPSNGRQTGILHHAVVDSLLCLGCGNCAVECPSKAIEVPTSSDAQILEQVRVACAARHDGAAPWLVFACSWSGFAAMELAGARHMTYPANVRVIELPCSARLDPMHVLFAFYSGAQQVMLALCPPDECHYGKGNAVAEARIETLRGQLAAHGIDPARLHIARMMGDDAAAWVRAVTAASENQPISSIVFSER